MHFTFLNLLRKLCANIIGQLSYLNDGNAQPVECVSVGNKNSKLPKDKYFERDQLMSQCHNNLAGTLLAQQGDRGH